jgi:hypothetical protein
MARHRYAILCGALVLRLVSVPVVEAIAAAEHVPSMVAAQAVQVALMMFACLLAVGRSRTALTLVLALLVAGGLGIAQFLSHRHGIVECGRAVFVCGMAFWAVGHLMPRTFRAQVVTSSNLNAAAAIYLLMGFAFANLFEVVYLLHPAAYQVAGGGSLLADDFLYFSFITLTTVGYGDVLPLSGVARMLAVTEALVGQVYLVLSVSRLVGLHVAHSTVPKSEE